MIEIAIDRLKKYYGATLVLDGLTLNIQSSERVGIIGENGCGKSTLMKILMGLEPYEEGDMAVRKGATLGYLQQLPVYEDNIKVIDILNSAFIHLHQLESEMQHLEGKFSDPEVKDIEAYLSKYSKLQEAYEIAGGYEKEEKLSKVKEGLKISEQFSEKPFSTLSGGEKTTVILGKILLENPNILLLDEPSNHLDLESMEWLEGYLSAYKGTVIIVSHDRYFLDNVVTKIIELEDMKADTYIGNYSYYCEEKKRRLEIKYQDFINQQKKIKAMEKTIIQLRDWGNRGENEKFFKRAASMEKALEKIDRLEKPVMERDSMKINMEKAERSGKEAIIAKKLNKKFDSKIIFNEAELLIRNSERVALIGSNGCGKSTFIKLLLKEIEADSGIASLGSNVKLGYLPQNVIFSNENATVLECFMEDITITVGKARGYLAKYLFYGEDVFKKVKSLSGGEKSRLKLAIIMFHEINMLILDEPTNHLDIASRNELEEILKEFTGTIFFISHDRYFINAVAERVLELNKGVFVSYEGNYDYYKEKNQEKQKIATVSKVKNAINKKENSKETVKKEPKLKERQKEEIEKQIELLENELKTLELEMKEHQYDFERLQELFKRKEEVDEKIEEILQIYIM